MYPGNSPVPDGHGRKISHLCRHWFGNVNGPAKENCPTTGNLGGPQKAKSDPLRRLLRAVRKWHVFEADILVLSFGLFETVRRLNTDRDRPFLTWHFSRYDLSDYKIVKITGFLKVQSDSLNFRLWKTLSLRVWEALSLAGPGLMLNQFIR